MGYRTKVTSSVPFCAVCGDHCFLSHSVLTTDGTLNRYRADNLQIYFESSTARAKKRAAEAKRNSSTSSSSDRVVEVAGEDRARVFVNPQSTLQSIISRPQYGEGKQSFLFAISSIVIFFSIYM
jgi:hypothetical protein